MTVHTIKLKIRELDVSITFVDKQGWDLEDQVKDVLLKFNYTDGITIDDVVSIETRYT